MLWVLAFAGTRKGAPCHVWVLAAGRASAAAGAAARSAVGCAAGSPEGGGALTGRGARQACAASARAMLPAGVLAAAAAGGPAGRAGGPGPGREAAGGGASEELGGAEPPVDLEGAGELEQAAARRLTPREEKRLLVPLLRLRQACCHPQARPGPRVLASA